MLVLGCDPGNQQSAFVLYDTNESKPIKWWKSDNAMCRSNLSAIACEKVSLLIIEYTPPYTLQSASGRGSVPNQLMLTAFEAGRFAERWRNLRLDHDFCLISRTDVKKHLLGRATGNDSNVTQAILDRYGGTREVAVGTKKKQGPLYGITKDCWAALALAITFVETRHKGTVK
jgi:hypothetical protein